MQLQDFIRIGRSIHQLSHADIGRAALDIACENMVDEIANICADKPNFDRTEFMYACGLNPAPVAGTMEEPENNLSK